MACATPLGCRLAVEEAVSMAFKIASGPAAKPCDDESIQPGPIDEPLHDESTNAQA